MRRLALLLESKDEESDVRQIEVRRGGISSPSREPARARAKGPTCLSPARRYENFRNFALGKEYRISSEGEVDDSELERQILEGGDGTIDPTIGTTFSEFGKLNQMKPEQQRVTGLAVGAPPVPRACPCSPLHTTHASAGLLFPGSAQATPTHEGEAAIRKAAALGRGEKEDRKAAALGRSEEAAGAESVGEVGGRGAVGPRPQSRGMGGGRGL